MSIFNSRNLLLALIFTAQINSTDAQDYIIYSVTQDFPMGIKDEKLKKNYFVNMGGAQGLKLGTLLDVYRTISQIDPYNNNKRHNFRVKVGELKVIHVENESAIATAGALNINEDGPVVELNGLLIGDSVDVHLK